MCQVLRMPEIRHIIHLRLKKYGFFDLLFGGGEAIQSIFQLGFIPKEEDFREFRV